jgi:hypothetical protein
MELRRRRGRPQRGQHVWLRSRYDMGVQPNGYIIGIDWYEKEVHMAFYCDCNQRRGCRCKKQKECLPLEDFTEAATWTDKLGGFYFPEGE